MTRRTFGAVSASAAATLLACALLSTPAVAAPATNHPTASAVGVADPAEAITSEGSSPVTVVVEIAPAGSAPSEIETLPEALPDTGVSTMLWVAISGLAVMLGALGIALRSMRTRRSDDA